MPQPDLAGVAARHVPGVGGIDIRPAGHGLVNQTYRVVRDGLPYAMRVAIPNCAADLGLDRIWEARVLESAGAAGLAPLPEYCDPLRGILIARWTEGRSWTPQNAWQTPNIARMAELIRRVHALQVPPPPRTMGPRQWIDHYRAAVLQSTPPEAAVRAPHAAAAEAALAARLRGMAEQRLADFAALPAAGPVLCHSDLHVLNLIDRGDSLLLLDWEYAHASDPLWDLAGWSSNNDFAAELQHALLTQYAGRPPERDERLRLQLLCWLYDYVCLLWSELYLNLYGNAPADGVAARAQQLRARLAASASGPAG